MSVADLKGVTDHSRGVLTEMRAARDLHTVSCTLHHSCARAGQEGAELAKVLTKSTRNGCHICFLACNEIPHLRLVRDSRSAAGTSKELLGFSDHEVHGVCAFLHCDIRASLHDCWAQLLLCVCVAGFQGTAKCVLETSPLSLPRRMPNQVAWKRHLCVNQRLFSVFRSGRDWGTVHQRHLFVVGFQQRQLRNTSQHAFDFWFSMTSVDRGMTQQLWSERDVPVVAGPRCPLGSRRRTAVPYQLFLQELE